ncbi:MAG: cysteine desulfurase, partial [Erysipelotrichaceae bacterium]|nr:cysteine desulfurase [Erysipelotrichaceae bacterium]
MNKKVYFDNVATTRTDDDVLKTYKELLDKYYCNSDALYDDAVIINNMMEKSRENIAKLLCVEKEEVIFTGGASEANSLAVKGLCLKHQDRKHIISTVYEHSSVYNALKQLEEDFGYEVTYLVPNKEGKIEAEDVRKNLRPDTILVSVMLVNNEIGAVNDIDEIKKIVKKHAGTYFHSDITQGLGKIYIDLKDIDLASFSAHKIHGLKGSGALIRKKHVELLPLINGGQQEYGIRGGTENSLVNIVLAKTLRIALERQKTSHQHIRELNACFKEKIRDVEGVKINLENSIDNLINISTPIKSEVLLNALNAKGIMVSSKSTCGSRKNEPNRALKALGIDEDYAIRVSFDYENTREEIDYFISCLKEDIGKYA